MASSDRTTGRADLVRCCLAFVFMGYFFIRGLWIPFTLSVFVLIWFIATTMERSVDKQVDWPTSTTDHPSSAPKRSASRARFSSFPGPGGGIDARRCRNLLYRNWDQSRPPRLSDVGLSEDSYGDADCGHAGNAAKVREVFWPSLMLWLFIVLIFYAHAVPNSDGSPVSVLDLNKKALFLTFVLIVFFQWCLLHKSPRWSNYARAHVFNEAAKSYFDKHPDWDGRVDDLSDALTRKGTQWYLWRSEPRKTGGKDA